MLPFEKMIKILLSAVLLLIGSDVVVNRVETAEPVALYPLNDEFQTKEKEGKQPPGVKGQVSFTNGPNNELNGAFQFTGNPDSFIEFPNYGGLDSRKSITLMCWVQPGGQDGPLFNYGKSGPWGVHIWINHGKFFNRITKYPNHAFTNAISTDQPLPVGQWVHVAATYDHNTGENALYVNGRLSKKQNIGTGYQISTNDAQVRMGVKAGDGRCFKGKIAQMKVYDVALSEEQIKVAMKEGLSTCHVPLGMENGDITDRQISASSEWDANHAAIQGRLNFKKNGKKRGAWSAGANDANQWLQVDLRSMFTRVTRVATQGRNHLNQWVAKYTLQYSNDGVHFRYYKERGQANKKGFAGNTDQDTIVSHPLDPPITARYIRFRPVSWHTHISMRVELYGCKAGPVAFYPLNEKFQAKERYGRQPDGIIHDVTTANGPNDERNGAYRFSGTPNSFIEFPNDGGLDTRHSITLMCWIQPGGRDGPLFNYRKSGPWGVHAWIVGGRFYNRITKYPNHAFTAAIATNHPLSVGHWAHVAATYDHSTGVNSLYVNGHLSKTHNIGTGYEISTNDAEVRMGVKDGDSRYFKGRIAQMKVFDFALDEEQTEAVMYAGLSTCRKALGMENGNIGNSRISASSQWNANHAANQGRLNFKTNGIKQGGWSARSNNVNQWLQIDLVNKFNKVTRVATQGRNHASQWVTKYMLQYCNDGLHFQYYRGEEKATYMEFTGNTDQNTVVAHHLNPAIKARYIRFRPRAWYNHISMRVELYGCRVCQKPLGMEDGRISNGQIRASSELDTHHAANQGRLNFNVKKAGVKKGAWSARAKDVNQWLQIDLGCQGMRVTRVATQGRSASPQWVTKYMLQYGNDGLHFQYYRGQDQPSYKEFAGNTDQDTIVTHPLSAPITARYIRFRPLAWHSHISMRVEIYGCKACKHNCKTALGMENHAISDNQISASSQWNANNAAKQGRLFYQAPGDKKGGWSASTNNLIQWLQVELGSVFTKVTYVATQGRNANDQWVTKYMLQYSRDGVHFQYHTQRGQNATRELIGNTDSDTVVYRELNPPIRASYVRFRPVAWHNHISMRVELYGCEECNKALGMENRVISNWQVTASSQWDTNHAAAQGRLFFQAAGAKKGAWSAGRNNVDQWLQIDLGCNENIVTSVATQGRNAYNQWVTKYMLQHSNDGVTFRYYKEQGQVQNTEFPGNTDEDTVVTHQLNPPIKARYIRFRPRAWHKHVSMRVELYGCKDPE